MNNQNEFENKNKLYNEFQEFVSSDDYLFYKEIEGLITMYSFYEETFNEFNKSIKNHDGITDIMNDTEKSEKAIRTVKRNFFTTLMMASALRKRYYKLTSKIEKQGNLKFVAINDEQISNRFLNNTKITVNQKLRNMVSHGEAIMIKLFTTKRISSTQTKPEQFVSINTEQLISSTKEFSKKEKEYLKSISKNNKIKIVDIYNPYHNEIYSYYQWYSKYLILEKKGLILSIYSKYISFAERAKNLGMEKIFAFSKESINKSFSIKFGHIITLP